MNRDPQGNFAMTPEEHALTEFILPTIFQDGEQKALEVIQSKLAHEALSDQQAQVLGAMAVQLQASPSRMRQQALAPDYHQARQNPVFLDF